MRGTFGNVRIVNALVPGKEGNWTLHFPTGEVVSIYDAAMRYQQAGTPLVILTGKEYGTGLSRDWAAKGPALLGVKAIIAESYERIHRSNLVGMGVLPRAISRGPTGRRWASRGPRPSASRGSRRGSRRAGPVTVTARNDQGKETVFPAVVRLNSAVEPHDGGEDRLLPLVVSRGHRHGPARREPRAIPEMLKVSVPVRPTPSGRSPAR